MEYLKLKPHFAFNKPIVAFGKYRFQRKSIPSIFFKLEFKKLIRVTELAIVSISFNFSVPLFAQKNSTVIIQIHPKVGYVIDQGENKIYDFFDTSKYQNFECAAFYKTASNNYFALVNQKDSVLFTHGEIINFSSQVAQSTYESNNQDETKSSCYYGSISHRKFNANDIKQEIIDNNKIRFYFTISALGVARIQKENGFLIKLNLNFTHRNWIYNIGLSNANFSQHLFGYFLYPNNRISYNEYHLCLGRIFYTKNFSITTSLGPSIETFTYQEVNNYFFFLTQFSNLNQERYVGLHFDSQIHLYSRSTLGPVLGIQLSYIERTFIKGATLGLRIGRILQKKSPK